MKVCLGGRNRSIVCHAAGIEVAAAAIMLIAPMSPAWGEDVQTVTINSARDNSLFGTKDGSTSSGAGEHIYSGRSGFSSGEQVKRAVMQFDVADAVPAGSTIISVSLTLNLVAAGPFGDHVFTLHTLLADWGEGTSAAVGGSGAKATPDDATWLHTFWPDQFWATPGGDYDPTVVGSLLVTQDLGDFTWESTPEMVADVQSWLDAPETNYGWILIGNETQIFSARKFHSREAEDPDLRPELMIEYKASVSDCPADLNGDEVVNAADLAALLGAWGPCPDCPPDLNDDDVVNAADLAIVLGAWGPC